MKSMKKNQIILLVVILLILIFGGIFYWSRQEKAKLPPEIKVPEEEKVAEEIFSLSAVVLSINPENNFLIVNPREKDGTVITTQELKVILSEDTKLLKLEFPFDPKNPPKEATFTPELVEVTIEDFKKGDPVFIKTNKDISGKTEIGDVNFIHILP